MAIWRNPEGGGFVLLQRWCPICPLRWAPFCRLKPLAVKLLPEARLWNRHNWSSTFAVSFNQVGCGLLQAVLLPNLSRAEVLYVRAVTRTAPWYLHLGEENTATMLK